MEKTFSKKDLIAIPNGKDKYILIQRLKELVLASDKLEEETDYYKNYSKQQYKHVQRRRELVNGS